MANEAVEKARGLLTLGTAHAEMDEASQHDICPTCGNPKKAMATEEPDMSEEQGGRHGMLAKITRTEFPGYKTRKLKQGERIGGGY